VAASPANEAGGARETGGALGEWRRDEMMTHAEPIAETPSAARKVAWWRPALGVLLLIPTVVSIGIGVAYTIVAVIEPGTSYPSLTTRLLVGSQPAHWVTGLALGMALLLNATRVLRPLFLAWVAATTVFAGAAVAHGHLGWGIGAALLLCWAVLAWPLERLTRI